LKEKYNYTRNRVIIDQINALASQIRTWNCYVDQHYAKIDDFKKQMKMSRDKKKYNEVLELKRKA